MNTSKLNESKLNNSQIDYSELDVDKIRQFIQLLEEHQDKCEKAGKFVEAEMARQRVVQFRKIEQEKVLMQTKAVHAEQIKILERDQKEELDRFNQKWDQDFYELSDKYRAQEARIIDEQDEEMKIKMEAFDKKLPEGPKPSLEVLNFNKVLDQAVKQKDYTKAHQIQVKIAELSNQDNSKFLEEKQKKMQKEFEKVRNKQENEMRAFQAKMQAAFSEFKKNRANEFDRLAQKYRNRLKELKNNQKLEISSLPKILKGIARPNSRITNIMKSASNLGMSQSKQMMMESKENHSVSGLDIQSDSHIEN